MTAASSSRQVVKSSSPDPGSPLYPFAPKRFDRGGGVCMSYLDEGAGDPVVMLHGNPTWSFYYRELVSALRGHYRCIAPDHVGMGLSDKPPMGVYDYSLKARVDDLEALLAHLGVRDAITLVMHDWGGMIGMAYAARHPDRVARVVAMNTGAFPLPAAKRFPRPLWLGRDTRLGAWLIVKRNLFCRAAASWCVTRRPLPADVCDMYLKQYDTPANRVAVLNFVRTIPLGPADPGWDIVTGTAAALPRFADRPTLLLWGMKDFVFDRHFLDEWKRHLPHTEVHTWPDCGHYLLEDAGTEAVDRVTAFLARTTATPRGA